MLDRFFFFKAELIKIVFNIKLTCSKINIKYLLELNLIFWVMMAIRFFYCFKFYFLIIIQSGFTGQKKSDQTLLNAFTFGCTSLSQYSEISHTYFCTAGIGFSVQS